MLAHTLLRLGGQSMYRTYMPAGEFKHTQEKLGWRINWTSVVLGVHPRTIYHYRSGKRTVHPSAALIMRAALREKEEAETEAAEEAKRIRNHKARRCPKCGERQPRIKRGEE